MSEMYGRIESLCSENGITIGKMCSDLGISRGVMGDLKAGRTKKLSANNVEKIARRFSVSSDYILLGTQKETAYTNTGADGEDLYAAFFEGGENLTEEEKAELWQDAKDFVAFKIAQKKGKQ